MTPEDLKTSPLENHLLPNLAMKPATPRLRRRALTARFTTNFIA